MPLRGTEFDDTAKRHVLTTALNSGARLYTAPILYRCGLGIVASFAGRRTNINREEFYCQAEGT